MGIYNEQGAAIQEPEPRHMLIKQEVGGSKRRHQRTTPLSARRQLGKLPPKDVFNDVMFMVGGWTREEPSCLVEHFCPEYNEWRNAAAMVNRRANAAACALDGKIYTVGGEDNMCCYSSVERFDPDTDSWSTDVAPLSSPRTGVCLLAMDGYLYAIGGHDGITAVNTVERFDPQSNTWTKQTSMQNRRSRACAAVLNGYLYVIGGNDGDTALSSVERYDPAEGSWSMCAHMLSPRENAACSVYLEHIYVCGGKDELRLDLCSAERFDPHTMRWTPVKRMKTKRNQTSLVVLNGALLAVGGSDGITHLKTIEIYNHETNTWRHFGSMKHKHPGGRVVLLS